MLKYNNQYDLDDPKATLFHREIILSKPFLKKLYEEWYAEFIKCAKTCPPGKFLEIGSGGGFLKEIFPDVFTSDILDLGICDHIFSAESIPFKDEELSCIMMLNVFHHIPKPWLFLNEAQRVLKRGGKVIMIEPANSWLGRFIYKNFHHEPFNPNGGWEIESKGPLSDSNQALPYIYFERDAEKFKTNYPLLQIKRIHYHTPFRYILSGGVSRKSLVPNWSFGLLRIAEKIASPLNKAIGLFVTIELEKI